MSTLPLFDRSQLFATDPPKLRPYQSRAIQALRDHVRAGRRRVLLVGPTAMGKMVLSAAIIRTSSVPVLFVCHRMELIDQCCEELARVGITNVGVIRADDVRTNPNATVQVASIQTLARREKPPAGIVLIDEAHRAASDSYTDLIFDHYKQSIILGFTATPTRYDGKPLGALFECLEIVCTYEDLIKEGFIVEPICYSGPSNLDLSNVPIVGGDYEETALGEVMRNASLVGDLLEHWLKLSNLYPRPNGADGLVEGPRRRTFIFATSIQHSIDIRDRFTKAGIRIAHVDGTTPEKERRAALRALASGDIDAITNVGVLLEGVDVPSAKCVVHARPTQSLVLWRQSGGRIFRPWHPGCPRGCTAHPSVKPMLLDHAGNILRLGFPHEDLHWELTDRVRRIKPPPTRICKHCFAYIPVYKRICPYCGQEVPPPTPGELPEESDGQLIEFATSPEAMRRMYFDTMVRKARAKGYKPGFASARYKERYGAWPPWGWSEEVKASFASDPQWQANMAAHAKLRAKIDAISAAKEKAKSGDVDDDEDIAF